MAGLFLDVNSGEVTLVASTAKSVLQAKAATNQRCKIHGVAITGKMPAGGLDTPVKCRLTRNSANFGTFTAATAGKRNPSDGETVQTTFGSNASVEPTTPTDTGWWREVQPQLGIIEFTQTFAPIEVPGGQSIQLELTSAATPILTCAFIVEE